MRDPRPYANKTVVVTGSAGYIGASLCEALTGTAARVLRVSRRPQPRTAGTEAVSADIRTAECWQMIVEQADVIFHLGGNTSVHAAAADPSESLRSTVLPIAHLVAAARGAGRRPRVIIASTATVYGLTGSCPVAEDVPPRPTTTYDLHKLFAEHELALATTDAWLEGVSLRLTNVYGPSPASSAADDRGVLNRVARLALSGADIPVYGGGAFIRDYVYIDDAVRALLMAGSSAGMRGQSFNVGAGTGVMLREAFQLVADRAADLTGRRGRLQDALWPHPPDPIECRNFVADIRRIGSACAWKPEVSFIDGIDRLLRHAVPT